MVLFCAYLSHLSPRGGGTVPLSWFADPHHSLKKKKKQPQQQKQNNTYYYCYIYHYYGDTRFVALFANVTVTRRVAKQLLEIMSEKDMDLTGAKQNTGVWLVKVCKLLQCLVSNKDKSAGFLLYPVLLRWCC